MREQWLAEIYHNIKRAHNERLSRALELLRKKAVSDPEVAEVLDLLRPWVPGPVQEKNSNADGTSAGRTCARKP
jgi:hypothetical protein